ncbi:MAG: response regulator transcription factor [Anaerolineae bacterium]|nr:response regulator transcription factor [Anaerolineae bacterium]
MTETIRILIADDHTIVRKGLRTLIASEDGMEVVGEAGDGIEAVARALTLQPDVILMDMVMPRQTGLEAIQKLQEEDCTSRILVLTSFAEDEQVFPAIKAGALGYLLKDASPDELLQAIYDVYRGEPSLDPAIALKLMRELGRPAELPPAEDPLTAREVEVLRLVARGMTNGEIAEALVISERTVANHLGSILGKLHLANRVQAALWAVREGVASLSRE